MAKDAEAILMDVLGRVQRHHGLRKALAGLVLLTLLGIAGHFVFEILPRTYHLKISGGDLLSNRHFLARSLQSEATDHGVSLQVIPAQGSQEALALLDQGQLDLAFVQGGLDAEYANVTHVATVATELLHFLVRPGIQDITDLRGKRVNLGSKKGGTRVIAKQVLDFSGLVEGVDYVESNLSSEELVALPERKMPEAIVVTSFAPSDVADYLVKQKGYQLLEIPFPRSLSLRLGWVADSQISAYMYKVKPAVPAKDIRTIGVNLHLVAHKDTDPRAVFKVLETLYSPAMGARLRMAIDESRITVPSGYPMAQGTSLYLERNNPLLSSATLDKIKALFGLVLSVASTLLVVVRWFKGPEPVTEAPPNDDARFAGYLQQLIALEAQHDAWLASPERSTGRLAELQLALAQLRTEVLGLLDRCKTSNAQLPQQVLQLATDLRHRLETPAHALLFAPPLASPPAGPAGA